MSTEEQKIKVLICGYAADNHTSFGSQIRDVWTRLLRTGKYEIVQQGWFKMKEIEKVPWNIVPTNMNTNPDGSKAPVEQDKWGAQSFPGLLHQLKPDLIWTLADTYMIEHIGALKPKFGYKYIQYMPIDGTPTPQRYKKIINDADTSIVCSNFGAEAVEDLTGRRPEMVYHGVDANLFHKYSNEKKQQLRREVSESIMDKFIIGWVGKDQTRKNPWNLFEVIYFLSSGNYVTCNCCGRVTRGEYNRQKRALVSMPTSCKHCRSEDVAVAEPMDNAVLWMHAYNQPNIGWDFNLHRDMYNLGDKVIFTTKLTQDDGLKVAEMANLYNMFDVFTSLSGGEGFGIPLIEAQACGVPVVYTNYSGQAEICVEGGLSVDCELYPEPISSIDRGMADINHAIEQFAKLYKDKELYGDLSQKGRLEMLTSFDHDLLATQHHEIIMNTMKNPSRLIGVSV